MQILVYSRVNAQNIHRRLGEPEYSYYFVLREFLPLLQTLGDVHIIDNPLTDVDPLYQASRARGEPCVFLSFTPPHTTLTGLACPTVPVFAWEFSTLPDEDWDDGLYNNWKDILQQCSAALTHCNFTVDTVKNSLGDKFPVVSVPSPVWDGMAPQRDALLQRGPGGAALELTINGYVLDSQDIDLSMPQPKRYHTPLREQLGGADGDGVHESVAEASDATPKANETSPGSATRSKTVETTVPGNTYTKSAVRSDNAVSRSETPAPPSIETAAPIPQETPAPVTESLSTTTSVPSFAAPDLQAAPHPTVHTASVVAASKGTGMREYLRVAIKHRRIIASLQQTVEQQQRELEFKQREILALAVLVQDKESELQQKQQEISTLSALVKDKERELQQKQQEILSLAALVNEKERELQEKQQEIETLGNTVRAKETELLQKQDEIFELSGVVRSKEHELQQKYEEILGMAATIREKESELQAINAELRRRENGMSSELNVSARKYSITLHGVVYTTVFNPADGRKNWKDMLTAFCMALRDCDDATLVFKITHHRLGAGSEDFLDFLCRLAPMRCRVVILWGYLDDANYRRLLQAGTYALNASFGEGQCMPLMECMSSGIPAVAPDITGMADYITAGNAFVVTSSPEPTHWQHDARRALRTLHYRPQWDSLRQAIVDSYQCARNEPEKYRAMQQQAVQSLQQFCSREVVLERLQQFLKAFAQ